MQQEGSVRLAAEAQNKLSDPATDATFQSVARGDRNGTLKLRGIPTFSDPLEKRQWMKEHMAVAFRYFGKRGYNEGISGHISMRGNYDHLSLICHAGNLIVVRSHSEGSLLDEPFRQTFLLD